MDPRDADVAYATFSGYRWAEEAAHAFATTDGGQPWQDISGNLPNAPVKDVVIDAAQETVYVASDVGVFYLKNGFKNWKPVGTGLPLARIHDLRLHAPSGTLFAATHGRSIWKVSLAE